MFKAIVKVGVISFISCFFSYSYASPSLHELRADYQNWLQNKATMSDKAKNDLLNSLKDYPLYPYAKYQYLVDNIKTVPTKEITAFITDYSNSPLSVNLQHAYAKELTERSEWPTLLTFPLDNSLDSRCRYLFALSQQNQQSKALAPVKNLWLTGKELPSVCDSILSVWQDSGQKTANLILSRIQLALTANNVRLARYLTKQLPDNYKTTRAALLALEDDPSKVVDFSQKITPSNFTRSVVMATFPRFVKSNAEKAKAQLPALVKRQNLSQRDESKLQISIAWQFFNPNVTESQIKWRDQIIVQTKNEPLIERRIRQALREGNKVDLAKWLNILPESAKQKDEWQYWQAEILYKEGKIAEGDAILHHLAKGRGFYAMLSAQKMGTGYNFDFNYPIIESVSPQVEVALLNERYDNNPVIQRISELRYWGMYSEASREWRNFLSQPSNSKKLAELARFAYAKGWGDHSVQATIAGKLWDNWVERFPLVHLDIFNEALKNKELPLSYALAIARQESALEPAVQSPAGARGLMQLMPGTAKDSAKKLDYSEYKSADQLFDPNINIHLGTHFLGYNYQLFDHNRILSAAAYNAGPSRTRQWLGETAGKLDVTEFIESIPFTETRNYVKSVLVYDYIYQSILQNKPTGILTAEELNKLY